MPTLPLLADPDSYRACPWDLLGSPNRRRYWLALFRTHFPKLLDAYRKEATDRQVDVEEIERRASDAADRFNAHLDMLEADPADAADDAGRLTILMICHARERALRAAGIDDAYRLAKQTDTEDALHHLLGVLAQLDALPPAERYEAEIRGVFAGNIYDLGATKTVEMFTDRRVDFDAVRAQLKPRPWRFDALEAWQQRRGRGPWRCAVLFVDNAGPDVVLGMLPLARGLLRDGTGVILTANSTPSLNDVTHDELTELVDRVAAFNPVMRDALADGRLTLVPSGNGAPLIDLTALSAELVEAVAERDVDLVVLEGMGRAVESNFDAAITCDCLKIAMIKDVGVAEALGGELFDLVMKFEPA